MSKQVIVVRRDLNMPVGKIAAQVAHAAMGAVKSQMDVEANTDEGYRDYILRVHDESALADWWEGAFTKPVLACRDLDELLQIEKKAIEAGLPVCRITDSGRTVFNGQATVTCLGIGPADDSAFDGITNHLRLY
jgi:peptidyl-tRNA hydrolase, PTH2 family